MEGEDMRNNVMILILAVSILFGGFIAGKTFADKSSVSTAAVPAEAAGEVFTLSEAADYLHMKEDFIEKIIIQEEILLENTGSFEGMMFPYLKAGDEYLFSKKSLDDWIMEAAKNRRVYTEDGQNKYN
ncbi:hypothetical protein ACFFJY_04355 [Fictibacillus aquaticus]|uniref:Helix-turn-helix domain-containing protein n=1 Tax=Fictibacillus aquaticus TaxID=2021314 RepID=A0A235F4C2_9BACL|nr:hypothetical protein [Fictibacillus aquaticus]OYD56092.1 hypothetical protein CGZ90_19340 [Fictibacillus aquaticus]